MPSNTTHFETVERLGGDGAHGAYPAILPTHQERRSTMKNLVQVAGIIDAEEAKLLSAEGVDWLGFPLRLPSGKDDISPSTPTPGWKARMVARIWRRPAASWPRPAAHSTKSRPRKRRGKSASQEDFVFYSNRIIRQLLETGMNLLPFQPRQVTTPIGASYDGLELAVKLCGVSVIRAGESMEPELRAMYPGLRMGKILIQRDKQTKLPDLLYSHLPPDIGERHVLLLEPMLATGGSALVAIDVLLKAGVPEEHIIFVNLLAAPVGLQRLLDAHPKLRVVTASVEQELTDQAYMIPGIGDFGDRYFGTAR